MPDDYYQNILYPLQDKILSLVSGLSTDFYLTGGTALSRVYLHHRYSDDLDFFANEIPDFKKQVSSVIKALEKTGFKYDITVADDGFARIFIYEGEHSLKVDFVNDVPYRRGSSIKSPVYYKTDNILNILSNKITALRRYLAKDVVDIIYICGNTQFNWPEIFADVSAKDFWVNPIQVAQILEQFPVENLKEIRWITNAPAAYWFHSRLTEVIKDVLEGNENFPTGSNAAIPTE